MFLNGVSQCQQSRSKVVAYKWIVTPHARKSLTLRTLLMTSRPLLSKTRTFHIGSPSSFKMGVDWGMTAAAPSACTSPEAWTS
jgi:hypothetical protein